MKRIIPWSVTLNFESLYPQPFHFKTSDLRKNIFDIQTQVVVGMHYTYSLFYIKLLGLPFKGSTNYLPVFRYDTLNIGVDQRRRGDFKSFIGFLFIHGEVSNVCNLDYSNTCTRKPWILLKNRRMSIIIQYALTIRAL